MPVSRPSRVRLCLLTLAVCFCSLLTGCGWFRQLQGENFDDDLATWGQDQRPKGEANRGEVFSLSSKAQQVERNLGYK